MYPTPLIGLSPPPDLDLLRRNQTWLAQRVDLIEIDPGTQPVESTDALLDFASEHSIRVAGRGSGFSLGATRTSRERGEFLQSLGRSGQQIELTRYPEHLGIVDFADHHLGLALPLPPGDQTLDQVCEDLAELRGLADEFAIANSLCYFSIGDSLEAPRLLGRVAERTSCGIALDLLAASCQCRDADLAIADWLDALPLERVVELVLIGCTRSSGAASPSGRTFCRPDRFAQVSDELWNTAEECLSRCENLAAIVLDARAAGHPEFESRVLADLESVRALT